MKRYMYVLLLLLISLCVFDKVYSVEDISLSFSNYETKHIDINISHFQINGFSFNITGIENNNSLPSNITIDICNNSYIDWKYNPYHTNISFTGKTVLNAWTTNSSSTDIYIHSNLSNNSIGKLMGNLNNNIFYKSSNIANGSFGIRIFDSIYSQIMSITTNNTIIHAFLPPLNPLIFAGLYIAEGGSTYYCNSDHTFNGPVNCSLSIEQALTQQHLARKANLTYFNFTEKINNPKTLDLINSQLQSCSVLPCNITIKIISHTSGNITLSDFSIIGPDPAANISLTDNGTHYNVNISPYQNITNSKYFYGVKPIVYVVSIMAFDDNRTLDINQTLRYNTVKNNLAQAWDNLTNKSHPLNFSFINQTLKIPQYYLNMSNYSLFKSMSIDTARSQFSGDDPKIIMLLDVFDYFSNEDPLNLRRTIDEYNVFSEIYINGFSDINNKTRYYRYNEEILMNIILHELSHSFVHYPYYKDYFHTDHPSSYSDIIGFPTNSPDDSPTGKEGYFEIYSVLNQIRPYLAEEDINNQPIKLSTLDYMLLGVISPYSESNYTFYEGNITNASYRFQASSMEEKYFKDANELYQLSDDNSWWDIKSSSQKIDMGTNLTFSIPKLNQSNRALWIYASDAGHPDHFKVFNDGSSSIAGMLSVIPQVKLFSPANNLEIYKNSATLYCKAYNDIKNITLYTNTNGTWKQIFSNTSGDTINYTIDNIGIGDYEWNCLATNNNSVSKFSYDNKTFKIRANSTTPTVNLNTPVNSTTITSNFTNLFTFNVTDKSFTMFNCSLYIKEIGGLTDKYGINDSVKNATQTTITANNTLENGNYTWWVTCKDQGGSSDKSDEYGLKIYIDYPPEIEIITPLTGHVDSFGNITFSCFAADERNITNISLYHNISTGWQLYNTTYLSASEFQESWTINDIQNGSYIFNCKACDNTGNCAWGEENISFSVSLGAPISIAGCYDINYPNQEYYLIDDIINSSDDSCINIDEDNVTLNCNGHIIDGTHNSGIGIKIYRSSSQDSNIIIKNCNISDWDAAGIDITNANNNKLFNLSFIDNTYGVKLYNADYSNISDTYFTKNFYTVFMQSSNNNTITESNMFDNSDCIKMEYSDYNYFSGINLSEHTFTFVMHNSYNNNINNINSYNNTYGMTIFQSGKNIINNSKIFENKNWDIFLGSSLSCDNTFINVTGSNDLPILLYNNKTNISNIKASEMILCNADHSTLNNITINGSATLNNNGLLVVSTTYSNFTNIVSSDNEYGIKMDHSNNNYFDNLLIENNSRYGFLSYYSYGNILNNSILKDNHDRDYEIVATMDYYCNNQLINVTSSNSLPIEYYNDTIMLLDKTFSELILCNADYSYLDNITINSSDKYENNGIIIKRSHHIDLSNINIADSYTGLALYSTSISNFDNISVDNCYYGIHSISSSNNNFIHLNLSNNRQSGSYFSNSDSNYINDSYFYNNYGSGYSSGISLSSSDENTIFNTTFYNNSYGLFFGSASDNVITNNIFERNNQALYLLYDSDNNTITSNKIYNNSYGAYMYGAGPNKPNKIYNNFFNNTDNVYFVYWYSSKPHNIWNFSCPNMTNIIGAIGIGGNFYATPQGYGISEVCQDSNYNGFCDLNYGFTANNSDFMALSSTYFNSNFSIMIDWSEWNRTETTNFSKYSRLELTNLPSTKFLNNYGSILFLDNINISIKRNLIGKIKIIKHKLWINSSLIPEFNRSARIAFRNVTLDSPYLLKDSGHCDATYCTGQKFNETTQTFTFNVTGFSVYELIERCENGIKDGSEAGVDCGGDCAACPSGPTGGDDDDDDDDNNAGGSPPPSGGDSPSDDNTTESTNNQTNEDINYEINETNKNNSQNADDIINLDSENDNNSASSSEDYEHKFFLEKIDFVYILLFIFIISVILLSSALIIRKKHKEMNINNKLLSFIIGAKNKNYDDSNIKQKLVSVGWKPNIVQKALDKVRKIKK